MSELDEFIAYQLASIQRSLSVAFPAESILGMEHSLADCDYFDTNRNFPEDGLIWLNSDTTITIDDLVPASWEDDCKDALKLQITSRTLTNKDYYWDKVTAKYLQGHQFGFRYLSPPAFKFYLAAWIFNYCDSYKSEHRMLSFSGISERFFDQFEEFSAEQSDRRLRSLTKEQVRVIVNFLIFVVMIENQDSITAGKILKAAWLAQDSYGADILDKYRTLKGVQDFIDRG